MSFSEVNPEQEVNTMNVYAWMMKQNPEMTVKLLKGESVPLFDKVEVKLLLEGYYSLKDDCSFELTCDGKEMGGFDQETGGCVKWPGQKDDDEDMSAHDKCADAVDKIFHLYELADLKYSIEQHTACKLHKNPSDTFLPERYHTKCIPEDLKYYCRRNEDLQPEATSQVAAEVFCDGCGEVIGWVNVKV